MKKALKALALVLCAAMLCGTLVACGAGGGNVEYGRYVEEDITPPGMKGVVRTVHVDGDVIDLVAYDWNYDMQTEVYEENMYRYRSENGGDSWEPIGMEWADAYNQDFVDGVLPDEFKSLNSGMAVLENGDLLAALTTYDSNYEAKAVELLRVARDGSTQAVDMPLFEQYMREGKSVQVETIAALPGDKLYISMWIMDPGAMGYSGDGTKHIVVDANTLEELYSLEWEGYNMLYNDRYVFMQGYGSDITVVDISTGQTVAVEMPDGVEISKLGTNFGLSQGGMYVDEENSVYAMDNRGILKLSVDGTLETIMKSENYSFGSPLASSSFFTMLGDEFLVSLAESSGDGGYSSGDGKLLRYKWDPKAPANSDTMVRVYSMYDSITVRLAISEFKKQHPEYGVDYEYAFIRDTWGTVTPVGDGVEEEDDALRILSTELLAGNGPDVLILDDLPMDSYIEQGVLEDLADVAAGTDIIGSILEPLKQADGKLYTVPATFAMPLILGEEGSLGGVQSVEGLLKAIEQDNSGTTFAEPEENASQEVYDAYYDLRFSYLEPEKRPAIAFSSVDEVVNMLYNVEAPAIYDPKDGLDAEGVKTVLEQAKAVADKYGLRRLGYENPNFASGAVSDGFVTYSIADLVSLYSQQRANYGVGMFNSFHLFGAVRSDVYWGRYSVSWGDDGSYNQVENEDFVMAKPELALMTGVAGGVYHPGTMAGLCTTSKEKDAAKEFIACLLSEGVQGKDMANGFPTSKSAFMKLYEADAELDAWSIQEGIPPLSMDIEAILDSFTVPAYTNTRLLASLIDHAGSYCTGAMDLDSAVQAILADSELYFAERQ